MHKIKPYSEYIQSELVKFIEAEPNQWQAKVIACLGFRVIYSFKEITERLSLSPVFILKTLLVAEKFGVVTYANDGWIINSKLNIGNLNEFLSLDIPDYDIGNNERMIYFLEHGFLDEKKELSAGPVLTEIEKKQSVDVIKKGQLAICELGQKHLILLSSHLLVQLMVPEENVRKNGIKARHSILAGSYKN